MCPAGCAGENLAVDPSDRISRETSAGMSLNGIAKHGRSETEKSTVSEDQLTSF